LKCPTSISGEIGPCYVAYSKHLSDAKVYGCGLNWSRGQIIKWAIITP